MTGALLADEFPGPHETRRGHEEHPADHVEQGDPPEPAEPLPDRDRRSGLHRAEDEDRGQRAVVHLQTDHEQAADEGDDRRHHVRARALTHPRHERDRADIVIIPNVGQISSLDTSQRQALITAGTQATTRQINAIKQLIKDQTKSKYATL